MSQYVFICDHASNHVPAELNGLGLAASELQRHIAWDIGAAAVTKILAARFGAPAIYSAVSRLVIDCNRHLDAQDLIPEISDGTVVPGNQNLTGASRQERIDRWFTPYHEAAEDVLKDSNETILVSIHSMTPALGVNKRPWQIALSACKDRTLADPLLRILREPGDITVGDNEPYDLDPAVDYSTPYHALRRGLPHLQIEFRQDEITGPEGQEHWADRFSLALVRLARGVI